MYPDPALKMARAACAVVGFLLFALPDSVSASGPGTGRDTELLKAQVAAQQVQIDELRRMLEEQRKLIESVIGARLAPSLPAEMPAPAAAAHRETVPPALASLSPLAGPSVQNDASKPGPLNFRIGSVDFTPSGHMEFAMVVRDRTIGSGIATNYGAIPFDNTVNGHLREYRFSAQTSRLGLRMDSAVGGAHVRGYLETDFLGIVPGNVAVTSNSDTLRLRLFWADIRKSRLEFLAGQAFTMMTPNRTGLSALSSDLFLPQVIDPNLHVGMVWNRNPQLRVVYHASDSAAFGVSAEASEQYGGGGSGSGVVTLPSELAPYYAGQINTGSSSFATPNPHQDIVAKAAFDPALGGTALHVEAGGVLTRFAFYNPLSDRNYGATGGGGSLNVNLEVAKRFRVFANSFYSRGAGRYLIGLGPDVIIRGDGSPSPVGSSSVLFGIEHQATAKTAVQGYYGTAHFDRNVAIDPATSGEVGFGYVGSPSNHERVISQGTLGVSHAFWSDPKLGSLQVMAQYSHLFREPWYVAPGEPGRASLNLFYLKIRYALPGAPPARESRQ
jgi:hypothetical protein